jgi:drug/metabolite transporter (DMT)-like permease
MLDISIVAGLVAMISWGIADFLQSTVVRKIGTYKTMYIGNVVWVLMILPFGFFVDLSVTFSNLILLVLAGLVQVVAIYNFYKSMKIGEISIVTPISGSYSLVTILLLIVLLGQKLSALTIFSIILLIFGIVLTSTDLKKLKHIHTVKGVKEALLALLFWGLYFFITELIIKDTTFIFHFPETNGLTVFFYSGLSIGFSVGIFGFINKGFIRIKELIKKKLFFRINLIQFIYVLAWVVVNYAISKGNTALITAVSSLFPAVTVILALIFYKEKLVFNQKLGILTILIGLFLISL